MDEIVLRHAIQKNKSKNNLSKKIKTYCKLFSDNVKRNGIRGYCPEGFDAIPLGCLSMELTQYLVCQRSERDWCVEKQKSVLLLSTEFVGCVHVEVGHFVAIASLRLKPNQMTSDIYCSFDIGKVQNITEASYTILIYKRLLNSSSIFIPIAPIKSINVANSDIRYYFENTMNDLDGKVTLDTKTVQKNHSKLF